MQEAPRMTEARPETRSAARPLRCAVVGVGHMGRLHAEKYATMPGWDLVAVADIDTAAARRAAEHSNTRATADYRELLGEVDAVSIAVPTPIHHGVARDFLAAGSHVLVEKPITRTIDEADDLIRLARQMGRTLQVGHLERYNAALMAADLEQGQPRFIEATRIAPFRTRGSDVSVVLDLMIHDIDLILEIVDSEVEKVDASGSPVLSDDIDIANARLVFANGCIANVTASRVSVKVERMMRLFLPDSYVSIDFLNGRVQRHRIGKRHSAGEFPEVVTETLSVPPGDALQTQISHFGRCIRQRAEPPTSGTAARRALALAARIGELLDRGHG
jgi:predicted dehydrogenase